MHIASARLESTQGEAERKTLSHQILIATKGLLYKGRLSCVYYSTQQDEALDQSAVLA